MQEPTWNASNMAKHTQAQTVNIFKKLPVK